jgi:TRAP-type C4-dicarboxylate transport system substrate-binding protein
VSEQKWKSLAPDVQQAILTAALEAADIQRQAYLDDAAGIVAKLQEKGIVFTTPDLTPFRDVAKRAVHQKLVTDPAQKALLAEIEKL